MRTSPAAARLLRQLERWKGRFKSLVILTHDHPDPDALAAAWALAYLAKCLCRIRCRIAYRGVIARRENRLMVESLSIPVFRLKVGELAESGPFVLIDTQPPFRNNPFSSRRRPLCIIDHHPRHKNTQTDFALIDENSGATTTVVAEALLASRLKIPRPLATAIVYGIGSETQNLGREAAARDIAAYQALWPKADMKALWRITYPRRPASFFITLGHAIRNSFTCRRVIGVHLGEIPNPELVAQMADFLMTHEKILWSLVTGRYQGKLHISLRTSGPGGGAGRLLKRLLGQNRGGGHGMIAGGSVELGRADEDRWREAEEKIADDFLRSRGAGDVGQRVYPFRDL